MAIDEQGIPNLPNLEDWDAARRPLVRLWLGDPAWPHVPLMGPTLEETRQALLERIAEVHRYEAMTEQEREAHVQQLWQQAQDDYWGDPRWDARRDW